MLFSIKHSVRQKIMLVVLVTTFVALFVTGVAMILYDVRTYQQTWVNDLVTQADILGRASAPALSFDDSKTARENLSLLKARPQIYAAAIYTARGALFASYKRDDVSDARFPPLPESDGYRIDDNQLAVFKRIQDGNEILGTVYLKANYELYERLKSYAAIVAAVTVASLIVAVLMSAWLEPAVTKPILAVTEVARQVMERRDFSLRVRKTTEDEIGYLVDTFNAMLTEVGRRATILEETNRALEHEMTERRGAESALLAADKRKDEFLATLAHELRNPLAPLRNALEILRLAGNDAGVAQTARDMMERQLQQLVRLVDDLLDVSRITTGKLTLKKEQVDLRTIVENAVDAVNPIIRARQQKLAVALPSEPVFLYVDATRLAQVFLNLLNNAAKFTDPEGQISFSAELKDGNVIATVTDTGIGIPADMLPIIFDMFAQADRSLERPNAGLGVGLSLAQRLVELHGGAIEAYSEGAGRGSRFVVRIPAIAAAVPRPAVAHEAIESTQTEARRAILLADDNEDFAASFAMLLRRMGHEVKIAHDGNEALDAALSFTPDLAFLDIGLPKINGYDLARRLRQELREKPIVLIAVTGWGQDSDKLQARNAGFDHHMVKPVEFEQIRRILTAAGLPSYQ